MRPWLLSLLVLAACGDGPPTMPDDLDGDGFRPLDGDCDDARSDVHPGAPELCDPLAVDEDCDGAVNDADPSLLPEGLRTVWHDADGDGFGGGAPTEICDPLPTHVERDGDCDDARPDVSPAAPELCDAENVDEDCDGLTDDLDPSAGGTRSTFWTDADADGYGAGVGIALCDAPAGSAPVDGDCNDVLGSVHPGAVEQCDPFDADEDCDGASDDDDLDPQGRTLWYADADADGVGNVATAVTLCDPGPIDVDVAGDCDDTNPDVSPLAAEWCDAAGLDEDCDELANDADDSTSGRTARYADADADGFGALLQAETCDPVPGTSVLTGDCDDTRPDVHPLAVERCDADDTDEDCDGLADDADELAEGRVTWHFDNDEDGFGAGRADLACDPAPGQVADASDCDDEDADVHPAAIESCDPADADEDCDGLADDDDDAPEGQTAAFVDADADGFGDPETAFVACDLQPGEVAQPLDCDDARADVNPDAVESCDPLDVDEDCDGLADDPSALGQTSWFADTDADGFGAGEAILACNTPVGFAADTTDCDDTRSDVHPAALEFCDAANTDEDCDGLADDPAAFGQAAWFADTDADGFGAGAAAFACDVPPGFVADATDCDDARADVSPAALEICDAADTDEDCDGLADDATAVGQAAWFADTDADGFGAGAPALACDVPLGFVADATDCDDDRADVSPAAVEICDAANTDEDCDGVADDASALGRTPWFADADADGFGAGAEAFACDVPPGFVADASDCDDARADVHPGALEVCDPLDVDEDCDLVADDDDTFVLGKTIWYVDADFDGYGAGAPTLRCDPDGHVALAGDCNDASVAISPAAAERCDADNVDEDCDGLADDLDDGPVATVSTWTDADADGFGAGAPTALCDVGDRAVVDGDCDDGRAHVSPAGAEVCDALDLDEDCDGAVEDADASVAGQLVLFADADGDAFGAGEGIATCEVGDLVANDDDCNDANDGIHPGAVEIVCDGVVQDCGGKDADVVFPGDAPTATAAIALAGAGEVVCFGPGRHAVADATVRADRVTLRSTNGAEATTLAAAIGSRALIALDQADLHLEGLSIEGSNMAATHLDRIAGLTVVDCTFTSTNTTESGGGLAVRNSTGVSLAGLAFEGNTAAYGGGLLLEGNADVLVVDASFRNNVASQDGGGLHAEDNADVVLVGGIFEGNEAFSGAGASVDNGVVTVSGSVFTANDAFASGGGLWLFKTDNALIDGSTFQGNAAAAGAGLFLEGDVLTTVRASQFLGNSAADAGGGMGSWDSQELQIADVRFETGAADLGGGLYLWESRGVSLTDVVASENIAATGAALFALQVQSLTVDGLVAAANEATADGGAIYVEALGGTNVLRALVLTDNLATDGAGLYVADSALVTVDALEASNNEAVGYGGGLAVVRSTVNVTDSLVTRNTAGKSGGGAYVLVSTWTEAHTTVEDNLPDNLFCGLFSSCPAPM